MYRTVSTVPTISSGVAYTALDCVGETMEIDVDKNWGIIKTVTIIDKSEEDADFNILVFNYEPSGIVADNDTFTPNDDDITYMCGKITIASTDYESLDGMSIATKEVNLPFSSPDESLFLQLVAASTPTYDNDDDLTVKYVFI